MFHAQESQQHSSTSIHELTQLRPSLLAPMLRRENVDLAYLLGAWTSMTEMGGQDWLAMSFTSQDPRQLALIQHRITSLFDQTPPFQQFSIHGVPYLRVNVPSPELAQHVREITAGNTRIPWEHLGTEAECVSFLQGIFDHGGWIYTGKCGGIGLNKKGGDELLQDLCRVFTRVGIRPIIVYGEVSSLKLKDQTEWKGFANKVPLSLPDRQEAIKTLAARKSTRSHYGDQEYESVMSFAGANGLTYREIGEATGIPLNTVRTWLLYGQKPPAVKRAEIIEDFRTTLGNPEVVNFVYRDLGASSPVARRYGARCSLDSIKQTLSTAAVSQRDIYGLDGAIMVLLMGATLA